MKALLTYEFKKIFQKVKWSSLVTFVAAAFFLFSIYLGTRQMNPNSIRYLPPMAVIGLVGSVFVFLFLMLAPMVISIFSYYRDLNKQHAVFETYIPETGWKRVAAKYFSYYALIQLGVFLAAILVGLVILMFSKVIPSGLFPMGMPMREFPEMQQLQEMLFYFQTHIASAIWFGLKFLLLIGVSSLTGTIFLNFFFTLHSALRHRLKGATPVTFLLATVSGIVLSSISNSIAGHRMLSEGSNIAVHPETILSYSLSLLAFYAMGWMLEHKTELK